MKKIDQKIIDRYGQQEAKDRDRNIQNGNEWEKSLSGQLILLSTVLLTAMVFVIGEGERFSKISYCGKSILILGIVSIILSIFFGVLYYFQCIKFYHQWAKTHHERFEIIRDTQPEEWDKISVKLDNYLSGKEESSNDRYLKIQAILILTAGILLIIFYIGLVYGMLG